MPRSEHVYQTHGDLELKLTVVTPDQEPDVEPAGLGVVLFHGGAWIGGGMGHLMPQAKAIAEIGGVTFLPEYRLLDRDFAKGPPERCVAEDVSACVDDAADAIRWAREHAGEFKVDPDRIATGGGSAGGHLALAAALCRDDVPTAGLVLLNPVLDLATWKMAGPEALRQAHSPIEHVKKTAPALILQGDADDVTPHGQAEAMAQMLRAVETPCEVVLYPDVGHGFFNKPPYREKVNAEIVAFLTTQLLAADAMRLPR